MEKQETVRRVAKLGLTAVRRAGSAALPVVRRLAEPLQRKREQDARRASHPAGPMPEPAADTAPAAKPAPPRKDGAAPVPPPAEPPAAAPAAAESSVPAPAAVEPAAASEPDHVDRGATLVRESADPGAARHVGAQIRVDEPWDGYADMRAVDIVARLGDASPEMLAVVRLYEQANGERVTVLDAIDRRLAAQDG